MLDALDHPGNFIGGFTGARGKVAHFIGHHRKTATLLAGTGRFDRGVERQQVGLIRDRRNHTDDATDFLGTLT
ncbi:hypothetical protein D3C86_2205660 [compost metagenome]